MDAIRAFFSKIRAVFLDFQKRAGEASPYLGACPMDSSKTILTTLRWQTARCLFELLYLTRYDCIGPLQSVDNNIDREAIANFVNNKQFCFVTKIDFLQLSSRFTGLNEFKLHNDLEKRSNDGVHLKE